MCNQENRAQKARFRLLKHMTNMQKLICRIGNLAIEHPQAVKEMQILVGSLASLSQELQDINARLDGSEPPQKIVQVDPWEGRKYIHYNTGRKWVGAEIKRYDKANNRLYIIIDDTGQRKTISGNSLLIK